MVLYDRNMLKVKTDVQPIRGFTIYNIHHIAQGGENQRELVRYGM
jgi:hypothetical protein